MNIDLRHLRDHLESEKAYLNEEINRLKLNLYQLGERNRGGVIGGWDEGSTEYSEMERCLVLERQAATNLIEVEHALRKFDVGTYGLCDVCNQLIEVGRLEALPQACLCMKCKKNLPITKRIKV